MPEYSVCTRTSPAFSGRSSSLRTSAAHGPVNTTTSPIQVPLQVALARVRRAKSKQCKDAGRVNIENIGPTEDAAVRRFAAARRGSQAAWRGTPSTLHGSDGQPAHE